MRVFIETDGSASYVGDWAELEAAGQSLKRRRSRLLPAFPPLTVAFASLRAIFGDSGRIAEWTRSWRCRWVAVVPGAVLGPFDSRSQALAAEVGFLEALLRRGEI